jgi:predicted metal-dependent peptidase
MTALDRLTRQRVDLLLGQPFWGALVWKLELIEDFTCSTGWTDGRRLGFNPAFIETLDNSRLTAFIAHEVGHPMLGHHVRRGDRNPRVWNIACDIVINKILVEAGFKLPEGALYGPQFDIYDGMTAEEIYSKLPVERGGGEGPDGDEEVEKDGDFPGGGKPGKQGKQGKDGGKPGKGKPEDFNNYGEVRDATNEDGTAAGETEKSRQSEDWVISVKQVVEQTKNKGTLPSKLRRAVEETVKPVAPWRQLLRRFMMDKVRGDYNWLRPNRRYIGQGVYLPSMVTEGLRHIDIGVDTSGSITEKAIAAFVAEINAILAESKASASVYFCDAAVARVDEVTFQELPYVPAYADGGGGTDFRPVFKAIAHRGTPPTLLVYLTDMYGTFPKEDPGFPVLWVSVSDIDEAPFGTVIQLKGEG